MLFMYVKRNMKKKKWKIVFAPSFEKSWNKIFSKKIQYMIPRTIKNIKNEIEWAWQRVFRGYDDRMIWSLNSYLDTYIPKIIRKMIKIVHGYPANPFCESEIKNIEQWKEILEKIAKGFDAIRKIDNYEFMKNTEEKYTEGIFKGMHKKKTDKKEYNRLYNEFEKGIELFKKYFLNLWD